MATLRAFMYHDVRDIHDTDFPRRYEAKSFLSKAQFEYQVNLLSEKYQIISSLDIFSIDLQEDKNDYAVLTFDDGLLDHYYVYNFLRKKKLSGTFLIPRIPILENKTMNTHKIQFILAAVNEEKLTQEILSNFTNSKEIWELYSQTKWKNNWWSPEQIFTTNFLRRHNKDFDNYAYTNYLFNKYVTNNEGAFSQKFYLSENQIQEMSDNGMVIGGHGDISENLLLVKDKESDIKNSHDFIKKFSSKFVFSYPNGGYDDNTKSIMRKYGCILSYTINHSTITDLDTVDYLEFPRYDAPQKISTSK